MTLNHTAQRTSARLRALLAANHMTHAELARKLGVAPTYITTRLNDRVEIGVGDLERFSKPLGYTAQEILAENFTLRTLAEMGDEQTDDKQ